MGTRLFAPDGAVITGTYVRQTGEAFLCNGTDEDEQSVLLGGDGKYIFDWDENEGTSWNEDETDILKDGERQFIDENNNHWKESQLVLVEVDSDGDAVSHCFSHFAKPISDTDGDEADATTSLVEDDDTYAGSVRRL